MNDCATQHQNESQIWQTEDLSPRVSGIFDSTEEIRKTTSDDSCEFARSFSQESDEVVVQQSQSRLIQLLRSEEMMKRQTSIVLFTKVCVIVWLVTFGAIYRLLMDPKYILIDWDNQGRPSMMHIQKAVMQEFHHHIIKTSRWQSFNTYPVDYGLPPKEDQSLERKQRLAKRISSSAACRWIRDPATISELDVREHPIKI